jgi:hypothetical protein
VAAVGATTVERVRVTREDEYFPLPRDLRRFLSSLQAAVEGGFCARRPGEPGRMERDQEWTATDALELLLSPS